MTDFIGVTHSVQLDSILSNHDEPSTITFNICCMVYVGSPSLSMVFDKSLVLS